jgi:predicted Zn-dependent protease
MGEQTLTPGIIKELEADFWGMCLLQQAGYNPGGFIGLLEILEKAAEGKTLRSTSSTTHPLHRERIKQIEDNLHNLDRCFPER